MQEYLRHDNPQRSQTCSTARARVSMHYMRQKNICAMNHLERCGRSIYRGLGWVSSLGWQENSLVTVTRQKQGICGKSTVRMPDPAPRALVPVSPYVLSLFPPLESLLHAFSFPFTAVRSTPAPRVDVNDENMVSVVTSGRRRTMQRLLSCWVCSVTAA